MRLLLKPTIEVVTFCLRGYFPHTRDLLGQGHEAESNVDQFLPLLLVVQHLQAAQHQAPHPACVHRAHVVQRLLKLEAGPAPLVFDAAHPGLKVRPQLSALGPGL